MGVIMWSLIVINIALVAALPTELPSEDVIHHVRHGLQHHQEGVHWPRPDRRGGQEVRQVRRCRLQELETVGDNMKQLEKSAEKALEREEKLVEKIYNLQSKYKTTEARFEYGEMNITKLNQRIDDIEDEIYREKLKIKKCSDELDDTF